MYVAPNGTRCNHKAEPHHVSALMAGRKAFAGDAGHFVIVVMATMTNLVNPGLRNLFAWAMNFDGVVGAHKLLV